MTTPGLAPNLALWHLNEQESVFLEAGMEHPGMPIKALYSMVSTGTEKLVATGQVDPIKTPGMEVPYQAGSFGLPIKYGYSLVGTAPDGRRVHLMHPHQQMAFAKKESLFNLPDGLSSLAAPLISNMETVVNAIWDTEPYFSTEALQGGNVAIVGFGNIGSLLALTLKKMFAVNPGIIEANPARRGRAEMLGLATTSGTGDFDLLFHTSGTGQGLRWCLAHAGHEGVIVDLSWYGSQLVELPLGGHFHKRRLRLVSSQVSSIPGHKNENYSSRKQLCAELLCDPIYQQLIATPVPFSQAPEFFDKLRQSKLDTGLLWLFDYQN